LRRLSGCACGREVEFQTNEARAISQAMAHGDGMTLNVSTGVRTSVNALWHALAHYRGWRRPPVHAAPRAGDIAHSVMANDLARGVLRWEPTVTLEAGLACGADRARSPGTGGV